MKDWKDEMKLAEACLEKYLDVVIRHEFYKASNDGTLEADTIVANINHRLNVELVPKSQEMFGKFIKKVIAATEAEKAASQ
jgi:hypothetical protein